MKDSEIIMKRLTLALRQALGESNLPSHCDSWEDLAVEVGLRLTKSVVLVTRKRFDETFPPTSKE